MNTQKLNLNSCWKSIFIAPVLFIIFLITNSPIFAFELDAQYRNEELIVEFEQVSGCADLLRAVKANNISKVQDLLKTVDPNCTYRGEGEPRSPLVAAARNGNLEIGKLLMNANADVEFHAHGDETPLMAASEYGHLDFVKYLTSNGAEINKKVPQNGTALIAASRSGDVETVQYLISQGADINGQVDNDGTPIICAVRNEHYAAAKILLENGADPDLVSPGDEHAMRHAEMSQDKAMIDLLRRYQ